MGCMHACTCLHLHMQVHVHAHPTYSTHVSHPHTLTGTRKEAANGYKSPPRMDVMSTVMGIG